MSVYRVHIPGWHPATVNELMASVKARIRLKKRDRKFIGDYLRVFRVPSAPGRRRVSLTIHLEPGQRRCDPDAYHKSFLDALVWHGLLRGDSPVWCELTPVAFDPERSPAGMGSTVTLEDVAPEGKESC